jgi:alcohol dehydrogenase class IV
MSIERFSFPTTIHFGPGARKLVAGHLKSQRIARPLLVTDRGIAALPLLGALVADLSGLDVAVFSDIFGNPVRSQVTAGAAAYKAHRADAVIGVGGGAALDVAKAVALMAHHDGDILDYAWDHPQVRAVTQPIPWFVALPTTAGTGSEVGRSAVVSDEKTHIKKIIFSPALLAKAVFADPELTLDLPASITAATGMDALTHNVESYLSSAYHPMCDGIALEGVRIAARALPFGVMTADTLSKGYEFELTANPTKNWRVDYSAQFDFESRKMISQYYSVKRELHCWEAQFTRSISGGFTEYYFKINVKNLPEVYYEQGSRGLRGFGGIQNAF